MGTDRFGLGLAPVWWGTTLMLGLLYGVWAATDPRLASLLAGQSPLVIYAVLGTVFCLGLALAAGALVVILAMAPGVAIRSAILLGASAPFLLGLAPVSHAVLGCALGFFVLGLAVGAPSSPAPEVYSESLN